MKNALRPFMPIPLFIIFFLFELFSCNNNSFFSGAPKVSDTLKIKIDTIAKIDSAALKPKKLPPAKLDSTSRVIYLTMDDGPLSPSNLLLKIAEEKQIKITEFAVGKHALSNKDFMGYLDDMKGSPYMEVCNHSYSHANSHYLDFYRSPTSAAEDMMGNETRLNLTLKIIRMPGRDIWATPNLRRGWEQSGGKTAAILLENGYRVYGWDIEWEHFAKSALPKKTPVAFVNQVNELFDGQHMTTPNHLVMLGHDEMLQTQRGQNDLRQIIDMLKDRGYVFEFMSNYPK